VSVTIGVAAVVVGAGAATVEVVAVVVVPGLGSVCVSHRLFRIST
jgi:hypothetical protein